jgi:hypothetical protein
MKNSESTGQLENREAMAAIQLNIARTYLLELAHDTQDARCMKTLENIESAMRLLGLEK